MSNQKRLYKSRIRQIQALDTRHKIIEAARHLFYSMGYNGTTLSAIAGAAGVAQETVYSIFRNKQTILIELLNETLVGDADPTPLLKRPFIQAAQEETDQHQLILKFATDMYEIMGRMSPIFSLLNHASKIDPAVAELRDKTLSQRLQGMSFFVDQLLRIGPLRETSSPETVTETVWALSSAEIFDLLIKFRGWTKYQYIDWLSTTLTRLLLKE